MIRPISVPYPALALVLGLVACRGGGPGPTEPPDPAAETQPRTFIVTDSISAMPVAGATVLAGGSQGVTDQAGQVTLEVPAGPLFVAAHGAGYDPKSLETSATAVPMVIQLRPAPPRVGECRVRDGLLEAIASDYAGRKTILRFSSSELTLEGPTIGSVNVPVLQWTWKAVDTWSYAVSVPVPTGEISRVVWRVYDRDLNVQPWVCTPAADQSGPF